MSAVTFRGETPHSLHEEIKEQRTPTEKKTDTISRAEFKQIHSDFVEGKICAVCKDVVTGPYYLTLSCTHTYCIKCFTKWNRIGKICAECRMATVPSPIPPAVDVEQLPAGFEVLVELMPAEVLEDNPEPPQILRIADIALLCSFVFGMCLPLSLITPSDESISNPFPLLALFLTVLAAGSLMVHNTELSSSSKKCAFVALILGIKMGNLTREIV